VIQGGQPCHLFLDLEREGEGRADPALDAAVGTIIAAVTAHLQPLLPPNAVPRSHHWLELDASSARKFSRHLVLQLPGVYFTDILAVGAFVRGRVVPSLPCSGLVDTSIYNNNRSFRTYGSCKYSDTSRPLRLFTRRGFGLSISAQSIPAVDFEEAVFSRSLVVASPQQVACGASLQVPPPPQPLPLPSTAPRHPAAQANQRSTAHPRASPFPLLDSYVQACISQGHGIYAVKLDRTCSEHSPVLYFHSSSKWCRIAGSTHGDNHTIVAVDTVKCVWWQVGSGTLSMPVWCLHRR
jgi:hypothetical protein